MKNKKGDVHNKIIHSKNKIELFRELPSNEQGFELLQLSKKLQKIILSNLTKEEILSFLKYMDLDDATDILQAIKEPKRSNIIKKLEKETREKIQLLLKFNPESAAGLMTLDYIEVDADSKFINVLKLAEKHEKETGKFPSILVVRNGFLVGELPVYSIPKIKKQEKIIKYIKKIPSVKFNINAKELPKIFKKHAHDKLVVVDNDESILGLVYSHDVLKLIEESDSIRKFAGISKEEDVFDKASEKVKSRYKWLIVNLATAFLAASVVGIFDETISKYVLLAVYMPIVAGMGGNAGTQTLAVFVRGIALGEIKLNKQAAKAILNEIIAGATNGLITGLLAAGVALFWNKSPLLGLVIGSAMIINLVIAGFFGAIIPLTMKKLGKDPATSATIFITTATDVFGFLSFLGLATLLL